MVASSVSPERCDRTQARGDRPNLTEVPDPILGGVVDAKNLNDIVIGLLAIDDDIGNTYHGQFAGIGSQTAPSEMRKVAQQIR